MWDRVPRMGIVEMLARLSYSELPQDTPLGIETAELSSNARV